MKRLASQRRGSPSQGRGRVCTMDAVEPFQFLSALCPLSVMDMCLSNHGRAMYKTSSSRSLF